MSETLPYDFTRPLADTRGPWNGGCPEGYFAQFVAPGEPDAAEYGSPVVAVRCRLMATSTPETIVTESGATWGETLDVYQEAARDALDPSRRAGAVGIGPMFAGLSWLIPVGLALLWFLRGGRR